VVVVEHVFGPSRAQFPKQFLSLVDDSSMLQNTLSRLPEQHETPVFICNEDHRFLVAEQVKQLNLNQSTILLEPEGRNTAPAVSLAALHAVKNNDDALLLVLAADHVIKDVDNFHKAIEVATTAAQQGKLVTFGIVPTHAETGCGYIKQGSELPVEKMMVKITVFIKLNNLLKNLMHKWLLNI